MYDRVSQKPVSAAAKPLGSELQLSRWVFLAQGDARQKLKICSEPFGNGLFENVFKHYVLCLLPEWQRKMSGNIILR
jgi:hypothetical protein